MSHKRKKSDVAAPAKEVEEHGYEFLGPYVSCSYMSRVKLMRADLVQQESCLAYQPSYLRLQCYATTSRAALRQLCSILGR